MSCSRRCRRAQRTSFVSSSTLTAVPGAGMLTDIRPRAGLHTVRHCFLMRVRLEKSSAISDTEAESQALGSLQRMLSPFSREEIKHFQGECCECSRPMLRCRLKMSGSPAFGLDFASPEWLSSSSPRSPAMGSKTTSGASNAYRTPPPSPPRQFSLPATLRSRLLPPSLQEFLCSVEQSSPLPFWTQELESIYSLVPLENWETLERSYEELRGRLGEERGTTAGWEKLQTEVLSAWKGIMCELVLSDRIRRFGG